MNRKEVIREYYTRRAEDYDRQKMRTWKSKEGFTTEVMNEILNPLANLRDKCILEVGIGSGRIGIPLLEKVKPRLVGLDLSKEMLRLAKAKMHDNAESFELVLSDAEFLPFSPDVFDALVCVSTLHYFDSNEKILTGFSKVLKEEGLFVYGDLSLHERDTRGFMNTLEETLSQAHAPYHRPSTLKKNLEKHGFRISKLKIIPYRKSFAALMEDKGRYFGVEPRTFATVLEEATLKERKLYSMDDEGLTLFFTLIVASKKENPRDRLSEESICIKVPKSFGEKTIMLANRLKVVDNQLEIQRDEDFIYIPLVKRLSKSKFEAFKQQIPKSRISFHAFPKRKHALTFVELLEDKLAPRLLASLPHAIDFVGDIAIIEIPPELDSYRNTIGKALLKAHKNIRTVLAKAGAVSGTYRLREFSIIAGEPRTETIHKEYGCKYYVDVAKAYFSPRLAQEHKRVASQVKEGETVVDMFAGVGPFATQIAKTHENVKAYAIDVNPYAIKFLKKNILLNRVESKVFPIIGEAKQVVKAKLLGVADRVIMNLPEKAIEFVDSACLSLKSEGGIMHFYCFLNASDPLEKVKLQITEAVEKCGRKIEKIPFSKFVRETAPYEWQIVLDAKIR